MRWWLRECAVPGCRSRGLEEETPVGWTCDLHSMDEDELREFWRQADRATAHFRAEDAKRDNHASAGDAGGRRESARSG